jgi:hypothetical protein
MVVAAGVSVRCARKWVGRNRTFTDRNGKRRNTVGWEYEISETLGMALSTVSGILTRQGMGRLGRLGLEQPIRYERSRPGELLRCRRRRDGQPLDDDQLAQPPPTSPTERRVSVKLHPVVSLGPSCL